MESSFVTGSFTYMKRQLIGFLVLVACPLWAGWPEYAQAVLSQKELQQLDILAITETARYRCPGCYGFTVTYRDASATQEIRFQTERDLANNQIIVRRVVERGL